MSKGMKVAIVIVIIVLLIFAILFAVYGKFKSEPINANTTDGNILSDANTGLENMLDNILDNSISIEEKQINEEENNMAFSTNDLSQNETQTSNNENSMTPKETKAIELVKEEWKKQMGSLQDVSFNVSIQNDGKYGVAVYDIATTRTIQYYIVDVETGIIKER